MALISQADLEKRFGPQTIATYLDDDGNDVAEADRVTEVLEEASDIAAGILLGSFSTAQITLLAANDYAVRGAVADIAADLMARRRPELLTSDGTTPYTAIRRTAELVLERHAKLEGRFVGEAVAAGSNQNIRAQPNRVPYPAVFVSSKDDPIGPGGF